MAPSKQLETLDDLLAPYIADERPEQATAVVGDADAIKLIAAWAYYPFETWTYPKGKRTDNDRERWKWIWDGLVMYPDDLAEAAGISTHVVKAKLRVLLNSRLVYPNGNVARAARGVMHAYITKHVPKAKARK